MISSFLVCSLLAPWTAASPIPLKFFSPPWAAERAHQIGPLLLVFVWPHGQQPLTHTIKEPLPSWATGKNASSKVKGHWPESDFIVIKIMKTKSGDHLEITHDMVLKPHKAQRLYYFQISSLYQGSFRKISNNLTSTKFVRFSTSFLSKRFWVNYINGPYLLYQISIWSLSFQLCQFSP